MTTLTEQDIEELKDYFEGIVDHIQDNAIEDDETETFASYWFSRLRIEHDARQDNAHPMWQETGETIAIGTFVRERALV
jgi:hypothetical protein